KKFFGSKPFSRTNKALQEVGLAPIDWQLPQRIEEGENLPDNRTPVTTQVVEEVATLAKKPAAPSAAVTAAAVQPAAEEAKGHLAPLLHRALTHLHSLRHTSLLPADWIEVLADEFHRPYFQKLEKFIDGERKAGTLLPREDEVFTAFRLTPYAQVKVVIPGDSPSCVTGQSHGLAYSVQPGNPLSQELLHLFRELRTDLGCWMPAMGCLTPWARQG